jgi:two-component system NtrC family sensor kinase
MRYKQIFFTFAWLLAFSGGHSQAKIDSLQKVLLATKADSNRVKTLNALSSEFLNAYDDSLGIQYAQQALALGEKIDFKSGIGDALRFIGWAFEERSDPRNALQYHLRSLKIFEEINNPDMIVLMNYSVGNIYIDIDDYGSASQYFFAGLKTAEKMANKQSIARGLQSLGVLYANMGDHPEALKMFSKALDFAIADGDKISIAMNQYSIGDAYFELGDYQNALKYDSLALLGFNEVGLREGTAAVTMSVGKVYFMQGQELLAKGATKDARTKFLDAEKNCLEALQVFESKEVGSVTGKVNSYISLGRIYTQLKQLDKARSYLEKCLALAKATGNKFEMRDSYLGFARVDSIEGDYAAAFENYKLFVLYRDSMSNQETTRKTLSTKQQYETEKNEAMAILARERAKNRQLILTISLIIVAIVFLLLYYLQYRNNKQKQKANLLLQAEKTKVEEALTNLKTTQTQLVQSEKMASLGELTAGIAHEIQNPLNFINNFSEINKELIAEIKSKKSTLNTEQLDDLLDDIARNEEKINHHGKRADSIVKGMLQHSRKSDGKKEATDINALVDEYLRLSYHGLRAKDKSFNASFHTDLDDTIGKVPVVPQDIGRVILNLLNNAFYAVNEKKKQEPVNFNPSVNVSTRKTGDAITITVSDNGPGIPPHIAEKIFQPFFTTKPAGQGTGLGLSMSYDIITKGHDGKLTVGSEPGKGSSFIIELPM